MAYWIEEAGPEFFRIVRDGVVVVTCGGSRSFAERERARLDEDEDRSNRALDSGDPLALCRLGWHRLALDSGLPPDSRRQVGFPAFPFFRHAATIGEAGGALVFLVADVPYLHAIRSVKALGNLTPWGCATCGELIPSALPTPPSRWTAGR